MLTARELAKHLGATLEGDEEWRLSGMAGPSFAGPEDLIFFDQQRHRAAVESSRARCVLVRPDVQVENKTNLKVTDPKLAFAKAAAWLLPKRSPKQGIHPTAVVAPTAKIGANVEIGPYAVIEERAEIGPGSIVEAFSYIGAETHLGEHCHLHPRVTLYLGVSLGNRVEVHSGAVIGSDGFGYVYAEGRQWKFPQIGSVHIGDDVEIGANTTIDRGSLDRTDIADGVKIDNLVQIAHNVKIGGNSILAAQTGVSGSSVLGSGVILGGQVGIADRCTLEDGAIAGAQAGIPTGKTIRAGETVWGTPARPLRKFKTQYSWFARLPELVQRIRALEEKAAGHPDAFSVDPLQEHNR